jgi:hypothetical protein
MRCPIVLFILALLFIIFSKGFSYIEQHAAVGYLAVLWLAVFVMLLSLCIIYASGALFFLFRKRFKEFAWLLSASIIIIGSLVFGQVITGVSFALIDNFRFYIERSRYEKMVADKATQSSNGLALVFIDWGSGGMLTTNFFYALVYDASDEIEKRNDLRTPRWNEAASAQYPILFEKNCKSSAYRLTEHFFSVTTICQ